MRPMPRAFETAWPDGAVWPREFQGLACSSARDTSPTGTTTLSIMRATCSACRLWTYGSEWDGQSPAGLVGASLLVATYCFWIAYADLDGFRIDAAKHMGIEALRTFCDSIREFAQSIGKERFLLVGRDWRRPGASPGRWSRRPGWTRPWGSRTCRASWSGWSRGYGEPGGLLLPLPQLGAGRPAGHRWYRNRW